MTVIFVGISNKSNSSGEMEPFDSSTPTGKIISKIESKLGYKVLKTNLVNFTPLDENRKIRYPNNEEIKLNSIKLEAFLNLHTPCTVFLLGKLVESSVKKFVKLNNAIIVHCVHHPSYIHVHRRSQTDSYIDTIVMLTNAN